MKNRGHCVTEVLNSKSWKDKTCYILGGGPSLQNFDFSKIENELTIGINKSFINFPTTLNYSMDNRFYGMLTSPTTREDRELRDIWLGYKGISIFLRRSRRQAFSNPAYWVQQLDGRFLKESQRASFYNYLYSENRDLVVHNPERKFISKDLDFGIIGGNNSGLGAIMLAIALGAIRIGLLGFDLKIEGRRTHWHNGYRFEKPKPFKEKLKKFIERFCDYAPVIWQEGIQVINLNKDSALRCFPRESIEEFGNKTNQENTGDTVIRRE